MFIFDFFYYRLIDIEHFIHRHTGICKGHKSYGGTYIGNPYNRHAKSFNLKVDYDGQNENMETYSGYDYITLKEDLDIVYFRDVVEYMKKECSEDVIIKGITFHTQYTTTWRDRLMRSLGKFDNHISLTGNKKTDDIIISKADSIFKEWIDSQPKFKNFKQSEWQL